MSPSRRRLAIWIVAGFTTGAVAFGIATRPFHSDAGFTVLAGSDVINIPTSAIARGQVRFFVYRSRAGNYIRLIIARDDHGNVEAAFDACERCYMYHRGYKASRGVITCRWCGTHYKVSSMSEGLSGCEPIKVPFRTVGQTIRIRTADLEHQSKLF
ncbi:MAG TPA: Fe-S-containing protein [Candidatus Binataceae bacterium]|nr:Fe-S-containing protein [Candidatus Binataceae bacterium]